MLEDLASGIGRDKIDRRLIEADESSWGGGREWHVGTVQKLTDKEAVLGRFQPHRIAERREELAAADQELATARKAPSLASAGPSSEALKGAFGKLEEVDELLP